MRPEVAIAVVSFNTRDLLRRCLDSLASLASSDGTEVVVVDNASGDGSAEMVRAEFGWVRLMEPGENLGFGRAVNAAATAANPTGWVVAANADLEIHPSALRALFEAGERHPDAAILAPRLELPSGETQESVFAFPRLSTSMLAAAGAHHLSPRLANWMYRRSWDPGAEAPVEWAMGALLAIRAGDYAAIGGFDETQWMYAEDLDICWRARKLGRTTVYVPSASVLHVGGASTKEAFGASSGTVQVLSAQHGWLRRRKGRAVSTAYAAVGIASAAARLAGWKAAQLAGSSKAGQRAVVARRWLDLNLEATRKSP